MRPSQVADPALQRIPEMPLGSARPVGQAALPAKGLGTQLFP